MDFYDVVLELIAALRDGRFQASIRGDRNQLASGQLTPAEVIALLRKCDRADYEAAPLRDDPTVDVHIFKPTVRRVKWYIKAYFIEDDEQVAIVLSVHPSDYQ